jgi:transposase
MPIMLMGHNPDRPIGVWKNMSQDCRGLHVDGMLLTGVKHGKEAATLLQAKAINGLSIGFRCKKSAMIAGVRHIMAADLLVSVRGEVESNESVVIQWRWPDSEGRPMWTNENRARYDRSHLRYPSDLTDDEWILVEPLIPPGKRGGDKRTVIMREVVNGLMYILTTGCQWRAIPKDLPPRSTLYDYFDLWSWDGTLDLIHHELYVKCREAIGREASPTAAVIDSQSVKSAEKGGRRLIRRATMQEKRSRARSGTFSSIRKAC